MAPYFSIQWHITDVCDQRCKHCYIFSEGHPHLISMQWNEILRVYDRIKTLCTRLGRLPYIYLTGGDPILHPDFWKLLELFKRNGTRFCVMGNPFHLTDENCARMKDCGCTKYQLSLDGWEVTHDFFRKRGSFRATMDAIGTIKRAGMWCTVMTTVSRRNMDEIPSLIDLIVSLGVDVHAIGRYCPTSPEKAYDADAHIPPLAYRAFLEKCWERYAAHKDGAPTVCAVFAPKNFLFSVADAFCAAENMVLEATELGVSSCIISRGEETFSGEEGEAMLRDWNVPAGFIARCFVILGYCEGAYSQPKPRRAGRFLVVEQREQI